MARKERDMPKSKTKSLPEFGALDALVDFFDENDLGDYWDSLPEVTFDIVLKRRRHLVALDERVASKLSEVARAKKVSSEKLLNSWLRERLRKAS
jgi:hypothetical protein